MENSEAYRLIKLHYGSKTTKHTGVPLINHIVEGLAILELRSANQPTKDAWCIHPLLQDDKIVADNLDVVCAFVDSYTLALAMEYRSIANAFRPCHVNSGWQMYDIDISPIKHVNDMLIADKVQNRKDFSQHRLKFNNPFQLELYFKLWLRRLDVSEDLYQTYVDYLS